MPIKCEEYNHVCVMSIEGDLAGEEIDRARKAFDDLVDKRQIVDFVIDFEKSGFIDSEGLELLLSMKRKCEDLFGQVKLAGLDENLRKILEITRLAQRFETHADLTSAVKTMR
ncbi:MAG TPA: STAS domain-containing protein [Tepidisphaeraceae bacterium]|nr:STAS domain-containing protein [Tepidisphaeraceae bacterium]